MKISENKSKLAAFAAATLVAFAFTLMVGAFSQQAVAQNPSGGSSPSEFAVGAFTLTGTDSAGITHVAFAAQSKNNLATSGYGYVVQETATGSRSGPVLCMSESSSSTQATVVWFVKQSNLGDAGTTRSFEVQDNGEPMMGISPDMYKDRGIASSCSTEPMNGTFEALVSGNIVVSP